MVFGAVVVAEAVIGETEGFGEQPAFAVVLGEEGFDALLTVSAGGFDLRFEVVDGYERKDRVTEFGRLVPIETPESLRVHAGVTALDDRNIAALNESHDISGSQVILVRYQRVQDSEIPHSLSFVEPITTDA